MYYLYLDLGIDDPKNAADAAKSLSDPIPLANVDGAILKKVIEWCQHHKDDTPTEDVMETNERRTDDIPTWVINN